MEPIPSGIDVEDSLQNTAEVLSLDLNAKFSGFISSLCSKNISFWDCVRVTGQLNFQIDRDRLITVEISEVVVLAGNVHENPENFENFNPSSLTGIQCGEKDVGQSLVPETTTCDVQEEFLSCLPSNEDSIGTDSNQDGMKPKGIGTKLKEQYGLKASVCKGCGKRHRTRRATQNHECACKGNSNFTCDICNKSFTSLSTLYHHKRGLHESTKPYRCVLCPKSFSFHHSLKLHNLKHEGRRPYKCTMCNKSYLTNTHLKSHVVAIHGEMRPYRCSLCNKSFPYENSLKSHLLLHANQRPHLCVTCGKSFTSKTALKNHEELHQGSPKIYQCEVCHKRYRSKVLLRAHSRRHTSAGSRFVCHICGHAFMYKSNLDSHYAVHGETRNFKCDICGKSFKTAATLHSHYLVHQVDAPFICKHCPKAFKSKDRLNAHERRHLGDRPYQCDLCGHCFPDKGGLTKHQRTVHSSSRKFECPVCKKTCSRADNLRTHMKIHNDPSLLRLSHKELMVQNEPQIATLKDPGIPNSCLGVDLQPDFMMSQQMEPDPAQSMQEMANVQDVLPSDFNGISLHQPLKQLPLVDCGSSDSSIPLLLQVSQDYLNTAV